MNKRLFFGLLSVAILALVVIFLYRNYALFEPTNPTTFRVGYIPIADAAPLYVAMDKGFFKKAGIEPQLTPMQGGSLILQALKTDDITLGFTNIMSLILAKAQGIDLISLGGVAVNDPNHKEGAILVPEDSQISTISDLKGKTLAINARNNIVELALRRLLSNSGLSLADVRLLEVPFPQMDTVLKSGQVDAIAVAEPFWTLTIRNTNAKVIAYYFADVYNELEITTWVANTEWAEQNHALTHTLHDVLAEAVNFLISPRNEADVRRIIAKYTKIDDRTAEEMRLPTFKRQLTVDGIKPIIDDMVAEGFLKHTIVPESLILH